MATREYIPSVVVVIETDGLQELIDAARQVPVVPVPKPEPRVVIDLTLPTPRREIHIPDALVTQLEDYELYVG